MNYPSKPNSSIRESLLLILLFVVVFLIYSNTFINPFVFDDTQNIYNNPHIRLTKITFDSIKRAGFESPHSNRPVANISFALNYYFHQYNVFGYHLVNMLIHIAAGILLYFFTKITLETVDPLTSFNRSQKWIPFFTALVWLVHPIQTQSVTYIVQRMNSLAAMFYVLTLLLYIKFRLAEKTWEKWAFIGGCIFSGILAVGSKETAVTLPFFIFLYEWYFFQDLSWTWLKRHLHYFVGVLILLSFFSYLCLGKHPIESILSVYAYREFTLGQRVMTEFRVVIFYISLLLFPHPSRLNLDHDFSLSLSLVNPVGTLFSIVLIASLFVLAVYLAKRDSLTSFCIFWFLGNLIVESSVIGLEIIFEHRTYLPSMLMSLLLVQLVCRYMHRRWLRLAILCAVVIILSIWTYQRNIVWQNNTNLWFDVVSKAPHNYRAHNNLGNALKKQGRTAEAIEHYLQALRINPDYEKAHNNLGNALKKQGRTAEAIEHYLQALRIKPNFEEAHNNLGTALDKQGRTAEAIEHYLQALRINPDYEKAHNNLGLALDKQGRTAEAIEHYLQALRINPDCVDVHNNLAIALFRKGNIGGAIAHFRKALQINPNHIYAKNNLKKALMMQQQKQ
jgi:tetratricopeptide (TPR) repeat protein